MAKLNELDWKVVKAYADCNMKVLPAARLCFMSDNAVQNHLNKVHRLTGLNPKCFYDLVELMKVREDNE